MNFIVYRIGKDANSNARIFCFEKKEKKIEKNYITKSTSYYYNVKNLRRKIIVFNSDDDEEKKGRF